MDALFEQVDWLYYVLVAVVAFIPGRWRFLGAAGLGFVLLAAASGRAGGPGGGATFVTINEILTAMGSVVVGTAAIGAWRGRQGKTGEERGSMGKAGVSRSSPSFPTFPQSSLLLIGLLLAAASPHLLLLELGILLAVAAAFRQTLASRRFLWLLPLTAGVVVVGVAFHLMATILGPEGGSVAAIADGPFSPAAERLIVTLLGAGILLLSGLMPLHRGPWGLSLTPLGAILLVRIAVPAVPGGLADWESLAILLLAVAAAGSFFTGRWAAASIAAGLVALWSGVPAGALAGQVLVLWGWLSGTVARWRGGSVPLLRLASVIVPGVAALPALQAALGAEVVLSVFVVATGIAAGIAAAVRRTGPSTSPLY